MERQLFYVRGASIFSVFYEALICYHIYRAVEIEWCSCMTTCGGLRGLDSISSMDTIICVTYALVSSWPGTYNARLYWSRTPIYFMGLGRPVSSHVRVVINIPKIL